MKISINNVGFIETKYVCVFGLFGNEAWYMWCSYFPIVIYIVILLLNLLRLLKAIMLLYDFG